MCREVMGTLRVAYTIEHLRFLKIHTKFLTDVIKVYWDNSNDYVFTFLENFAKCKNNRMYALTKKAMFYLGQSQKKAWHCFKGGLKAL